MNALILFSACVAASQAQFIGAPYGLGAPYGFGAPYAYGHAGPNGYGLGAPYLANGAPFLNAAPVAAAPLAAAPLNPSTQFHAQDEFGNTQYGYSNINSAKHEAGNTYGGVSGSYSYVDANGILQTTNYIADGLGFRVQATNLPVAPSVNLEQPTFNLVGPAPVQDTVEVAAAKAEFQAAFDEAASRTKRSTPAATAPLLAAPLAAAPAYAYGAYPYGGNSYGAYPHGAYSYGAYPHAYGFAAPYGAVAAPSLTYAHPAPVATVVASAPATREGILTTVKLNPGHAVSYRVD